MALLYELVSLLTEEQKGSLLKVSLPNREREVLCFVLSQRKKVFPSATALKKLQMSQNHFEKACSILLRKVLVHFGGDSALSQFKFVKGIEGISVRLMRYLMSYADKQITASAEKAEFYVICSYIVTRFPHTDLDLHEINYYAKKLLLTIDINTRPAEYIKTKADPLYAALNKASMDMTIKQEKVCDNLEKKIRALLKEAEQTCDKTAIYQARYILVYFYTVASEVERLPDSILSLIEVADSAPLLFTPAMQVEPKLLYAEALGYVDRFQESYDLFEKLLGRDGSGETYVRLASKSRFFKVAVTLGKYDTAKKILDANFAECLSHTRQSQRTMAHMQYICYFLHIGELSEAETYINAIRKEVHKQKSLQYEIQLRTFENMLMYLKGDVHNAELQAQRNLKFLRSKNITIKNSDFPHPFVATGGIYDHCVLGKAMSLRQQRAYDYCFRESYSHYGGILKRMYEMKIR